MQLVEGRGGRVVDRRGSLRLVVGRGEEPIVAVSAANRTRRV
jgi:hypothetical protein